MKQTPAPEIRNGCEDFHCVELCSGGLLQGFCQRLDQCRHFRVLQELHQQGRISCIRSRLLRLLIPAGVECLLKELRVLPAVIVEDVGIQVGNHLGLGVPGVTLHRFDVSPVEFQLVGDAGVAQRVKDCLGQIALLDELVEGTVDSPGFHRHAQRPGDHQIKVPILVTKGIDDLQLLAPRFGQHLRSGSGQKHLANAGFRLGRFEHLLGGGQGGLRRENKNDILLAQELQRFTIDALKLFVDVYTSWCCFSSHGSGQ